MSNNAAAQFTPPSLLLTTIGLSLQNAGSFPAAQWLTTFAYGPAAHMAVTDFNGDGRPDVAERILEAAGGLEAEAGQQQRGGVRIDPVEQPRP